MSEHVQPPWYANGTVVYIGADGGFSLRCCPNPEANASHIVKCVNSHDRLAELLELAVGNLEIWKADCGICKEARALLTEIEGLPK